MLVPENLIDKFGLVKKKNSYYGAFAKDGTDHVAIVVSIYNNTVHYFCITSSEDFINARLLSDPDAVVSLEMKETVIFFPNDTKKDWIYCGAMNWGQMPLDDFKRQLATGIINYINGVPDDLFEKIIDAIKASDTYSEEDLTTMGIL